MAKYIGADALLQILNGFNDYENGDKHFLNAIRTVEEIVQNMDAADVVAVVRCRDCKFDDGIGCCMDYDEYQAGEGEIHHRRHGWTDYCSGGMRWDSIVPCGSDIKEAQDAD